MRIYQGNCLDILKKMDSRSVDSIVCDPPYGINMMRQNWDKSLPEEEIWRECHRVLRPGGYILAFGSAIHYHHLAAAMEEAKFETQNMLAWIYSNGFPRGTKLDREFDRKEGLPVPDDEFRSYLRNAVKRSGYKTAELEKMCGTVSMFRHYLGKSQATFPTYKNWQILKKALKLDSRYDETFEKIEKRRKEFKSKKEGERFSRHFEGLRRDFKRYTPVSDLAKKWKGYEYGKMTLRPCLEPIYFGQKAPIRPVRENVKAYSTGALNVEGCKQKGRDGKLRGPSSVIHDGTLGELLGPKGENSLNKFPSPFFYIPKPNKKEREGNTHPTLKPISLMCQLVRLVTPPKGVCLDPFMGSGTTGVACMEEGLNFMGIEREGEYFEIAEKRINKMKKATDDSLTHSLTTKKRKKTNGK